VGQHQTQIGLESIDNENWRGKTVLDIGCGSGKLSLQVYRATQPNKYIGVDISPKKIEMAKLLFQENNIKNAFFSVCDSAQLKTIDKNSIDIIFRNIAFQEFKDKLSTLKEMYRVLIPEGKVIINTIEEKSKVLQLMETIAKVKPGKSSKVTKLEFDKLAKSAGFFNIYSASFNHTIYYPTVNDLLDGYQKFEVVFPKLADLSREQLDRMWQELKKRLELTISNRGFGETWKILNAKLQK
jgi:ubiquinone/menaquinone biosynthesis C-methylase UbiE